MDKKTEFNEALQSLVEYATVNGNIITKENVYDYFKGILDDDSMYKPVFQYLTENRITVEGYDIESGSPLMSYSNNDKLSNNETSAFTPEPLKDTEKALMFLDMYYEDVQSLDKADNSELKELVKGAINKDKTSIDKLTETFLENVIKIADEFEDSGLKKSDLISEGNLGLFETIINLTELPKDIISYFESSIRTAMNDAIQREISVLRIANHITDKANAVSDATTALAEKLGREATIEELCEYLSLPQEQVREILKISLDAVNIVNE